VSRSREANVLVGIKDEPCLQLHCPKYILTSEFRKDWYQFKKGIVNPIKAGPKISVAEPEPQGAP
jgi:hypothetical protein